jgi:hypothetical protein
VRRVVVVSAWILVAAAGFAVGRLALPRTGLRGEYFDNLTHSGTPVAVTVDQAPSTELLHTRAAIWPSYSAEWSGFVVIDSPGTYTFATVSDDGSELDVDDQVVVRNGGLHGPQEARGRIALTAGIHPLRVRYEQAGGGYALAITYASGDGALAPLPETALLLDSIPYWQYRLRGAVPLLSALGAVLLWIGAASRLRRILPPPVSTRMAIDRPAVAIAVIVAVGVTVRIVMMLGSNAILFADSDVFLTTVDSIRAGRPLEHDPFRTLLYPFFLDAFLRWSAEPPIDQVIVAAQHLLGILTTVCVYVAGRRAMGPRAALAGALLLSMHTTQLFYENSILSEALFTFLLAAALIPMGSYVETPTTRGAIATAAACAALTLTRPVAQWFVAVPIAISALSAMPWKERLRGAAITAAVYAMLLVPWALVNQQQFHFFGIALGRGFGLFIREFDMDREPPPVETAYPEVRDVLVRGLQMPSPATYVRDELGDGRKYSVPQKEELMSRFAMESIARHRVRFAVNTVKEWYQLIGHSLGDERVCSSAQGPYICTPRTQGYARGPFLNRPRHDREPMRALVVAYFRHLRIPIGIAFALAVFGVIAYAAGRPPGFIQGVLLAGTVIYFTLVPSVAQAAQDRYRLPIDGLLFLFAAYGAARLMDQVRPASATGGRE